MFFGDTSNHDQISKIKTGVFERKNITVPANGEMSERERYGQTSLYDKISDKRIYFGYQFDSRVGFAEIITRRKANVGFPPKYTS